MEREGSKADGFSKLRTQNRSCTRATVHNDGGPSSNWMGVFGFQNKRYVCVRFSERVFDFQNKRKNPLSPSKRFMVYKLGLNLLVCRHTDEAG
jgi:hypothetical protein